jgi:hypothetical protein
MKWIKKNLFALITLNTPHLGCISPKFLVNTGKILIVGIKVLNLFSSKLSLRQMSLSDKNQKIEKMSKYETLKWFKNIFILSSIDDGYAPVPSAKIFLKDFNKKSLHSQMVFNFWNNVQVKLIF